MPSLLLSPLSLRPSLALLTCCFNRSDGFIKELIMLIIILLLLWLRQDIGMCLIIGRVVVLIYELIISLFL